MCMIELPPILAEVTSLRELNLEGCINLGLQGLFSLVALTNLETLSLSKCNRLGDGFPMVPKQLPSFTQLDISHCTLPSDASHEIRSQARESYIRHIYQPMRLTLAEAIIEPPENT